jgi:multidrug transporter EmrE-like cation transporter
MLTTEVFGYSLLTPRDGVDLLILYGTIILSFMSGVLWGFATRTDGVQAIVCYVLSVVPALWALLVRGTEPGDTLLSLTTGFMGLLALDFYFFRAGLTPPWWMRLRVLLTGIVAICLILGQLA